ncbi:pyrophosphatase PpaX [Clostridium zeae]|uniref:Pyrophosphatase PpaX n=1 Tax=Clostridium zeae TaxID=2759022 RepID=A0ABQ1EA58_9CLOT|nr:pyrophosphatase PpaX [Clostridium zeae]GFZ31629.1 pyrophosphatase PpaX [Clostridium zeae]
MIKAVLFDLDGTLLDTNELIINSFKHVFENILKIQVSEAEITKKFGMPLSSSFKDYTDSRIDELVVAYRAYNEERHDTMCYAFDGVKELLDKLKGMGIKIGIVTSKRKKLAEKGMKIAGILEYMDVIITPECTENHKPHGEPALKACSELNILPSEAIMVGDSHLDIMCGKSAGCQTCAVEYTVLPIETLVNQQPNYFIKTPEQLVEIVKNINVA